MKAVILAAGKGTRMGGLTNETPKPMLRVQGKPILEHILTGLMESGIRDFFIVTGFRAEVIEEFFGDGRKWNARIQYGRQITQDGTGKAPEVAKEFVGQDDFVLTYGDILVAPRTYQDMARRYAEGAFSGLITCTGSQDVTQGGLLFFDGAFCLRRLVEKPSAAQLDQLRRDGELPAGGTAWYNAGIYIFKPVLFDFTARLQKSPRGEYELTDAIDALVAAGHRLAGLEIQGRWVDVRDPQVLAALEKGGVNFPKVPHNIGLVATNPLIEIRNGRAGKAEALRALGLNPYPSRSRRTHYTKTILTDFEALQGQTVTVAGRLLSWRKQGALAFAHLQDQTGKLQLFLRRNLVQPTDAKTATLGYAETNLLDIGDIVEATGKVIRTERGEISVLVENLRLLTKAIRPLPDQWSGLKDREQVLRKRYLDAILEPESFARFGAVSKMIAAIRAFLNERGFMEFHTPIIQPQYGGGTAKPFKTHVNALGCEMYLAISHELYLKRLILAGFDKVYTIGRYFRNEGIDRSHHPEFSMVETMTAYENYEYNMNLVEEMFRHVATQAFGRTEFTVHGHAIDFAKPWRRVSMADAVKEKTGIDFRACASVDQANAHLAGLGVKETLPSVGEAMVKAFEVTVEKDLIQPTLVFGHPIEISPLAKPMAEDPRYVERFEIFIAGMECGDNWSEQNDPVHLLNTWRKSYKAEERDAGKFHTLDFDFIEALEYGLPPTTGIGPGIERMAMIFTGQENIDDVIFFPMMRPTVSPLNAAIYNVREDSVAPVEDLAVSFKEFETLCDGGLLKPHARNLMIKPHLWIWPSGAQTCHAEIEGFLPNAVVRLSECPGKSPEGDLGSPLRRYLEKKFPGREITVSPATVLRHG